MNPHLLSSFTFGLFLFLLWLFGIFASGCCGVGFLGRCVLRGGGYVSLFLTVPVQVLLGLGVVVILQRWLKKKRFKHFCKSKEEKKQKMSIKAEHLRDCWGRSKGQFEGHNNSQKTHQTDTWMCLELHTEQV